MLNITINNEEFEYIDSIKIDDKTYISYTDGKNKYISEYRYINKKLVIFEVDDATLKLVKEKMDNEK